MRPIGTATQRLGAQSMGPHSPRMPSPVRTDPQSGDTRGRDAPPKRLQSQKWRASQRYVGNYAAEDGKYGRASS